MSGFLTVLQLIKSGMNSGTAILSSCFCTVIRLFALRDSRQLYAATRLEYEQIERDIDQTFKYLQREKASQRQSQGACLKEEELAYLETQTLKMPPRAVEYARLLIDLEIRQNTIAINAKNYRNKLNQISIDIKGSNKYSGSDANLSFLKFFSLKTSPQFEE
ncbi:hypothetical protein [Microcoleus sp. herbarium14]|uniref:hypothetical protein n=1 Tax=Microcoleus sp. herbarium14 TaxID=3055439 RepID=UPI002FD309CA